MMTHPDAWEHISFKDVCVKVANVEVYYKALSFYLSDHPTLASTLLTVLTPRVDHARVVDLMRKANHLVLVKPYLASAQSHNLTALNDAVNDLAIEEEDFEALRNSIDTYDNFDQISLALRCETISIWVAHREAPPRRTGGEAGGGAGQRSGLRGLHGRRGAERRPRHRGGALDLFRGGEEQGVLPRACTPATTCCARTSSLSWRGCTGCWISPRRI